MEFIAGQIKLLTLMALPFLFAVTMPLAAKAYVANYLGDPTPKLNNRVSFDPLRHIDRFGTLVMPLISVMIGLPILLGHGKQLETQPNFFRKGKHGMALFALAGPLANLVVALIFAYFLRLVLLLDIANPWVVTTLQYGVLLNCVFLVINLLPIPPLDGAMIITQYLPRDMAESYWAAAPYGFFIILGIFFLAQEIIFGPTMMLTGLLLTLVGVA